MINYHLKIHSINKKKELTFIEDYVAKLEEREISISESDTVLTIYKEDEELIIFPFNPTNPNGSYRINDDEILQIKTLTEGENKLISWFCSDETIEIEIHPEIQENGGYNIIFKEKTTGKTSKEIHYSSEEESQAFIDLAIETLDESV